MHAENMKTAREISGHKTDAVFSRYNTVSEADIRDAARKNEQGAKAVIHAQLSKRKTKLNRKGMPARLKNQSVSKKPGVAELADALDSKSSGT